MASRELNPVEVRLAAVLAEMPEVRLAYLFGSRALGRARPEGDFDIAVLVDALTARGERGRTIRRLAGKLGARSRASGSIS